MGFQALKNGKGGIIRVRPTKFKTPHGSMGRSTMAQELKYARRSLVGRVKKGQKSDSPGGQRYLNQLRSSVKYHNTMAKNKLKSLGG